MFCFCGPQASWECTREDDWCQHPGTESQLSWPLPNIITHIHLSIIRTAVSAPHSKPAWGLIGWKINPESEEEEKVVGSFASTHKAVKCKQLSWHCWRGGHSLWGALSWFVSKGFPLWSHKLRCCLVLIIILMHYIDALLVSPSSQRQTYFHFHTKCHLLPPQKRAHISSSLALYKQVFITTSHFTALHLLWKGDRTCISLFTHFPFSCLGTASSIRMCITMLLVYQSVKPVHSFKQYPSFYFSVVV